MCCSCLLSGTFTSDASALLLGDMLLMAHLSLVSVAPAHCLAYGRYSIYIFQVEIKQK